MARRSGIAEQFGQGYAIGRKIGDDFRTKRSIKGMNEATDELENYLIDAGNNSSKVLPDGVQGPVTKPPTTRDLLGIHERYKEAARRRGDADWEEKADQKWAKLTGDGYQNFMKRAGHAADKQDWDEVGRMMQAAGAMRTDGITYEFKKNDKGELVASGYDETSGKKQTDKVVTSEMIAQHAIGEMDYAGWLAMQKKDLQNSAKTRESQAKLDQGQQGLNLEEDRVGISQQNADTSAKAQSAQQTASEASAKVAQERSDREATILPYKVAELLTNQQHTMALADKADRVGKLWTSTADQRAFDTAYESAFENATGDMAEIFDTYGGQINTVGAILRQKQGSKGENAMADRQLIHDVSELFKLAHEGDAEANARIEALLGGNSHGMPSQGIPAQ